MKADSPNLKKFSQDFNAQNTFISGSTDALLTVAPTELAKLDAENKTILVTDPYLFPPSPYAGYKDDLLKILRSTKAKAIVFCAKRKKNDALFQELYNALDSDGIPLTFDTRLEDCHDRFWYCPETEKCVIFGTSMNGIGRKICRIDMLRDDEVVELKKYFTNAGILSSGDNNGK